MKRGPRTQIRQLSHSRWLAYAAAGAASTLASGTPAEAEIHYSGTLNVKLDNPHGVSYASFSLENGASIFFGELSDSSFPTYNFAFFGVAARSKAWRARRDTPLRLRSGVQVSEGRFVEAGFSVGWMIGPYPFFPSHVSHFKQGGDGFIGFRFDTGAGTQYGWARVRMSGFPRATFIVHDYAWADPGEPIQTGQTATAPEKTMVPASGSLGLLASGAIGLETWRSQRAAAADLPYEFRQSTPRPTFTCKEADTSIVNLPLSDSRAGPPTPQRARRLLSPEIIPRKRRSITPGR